MADNVNKSGEDEYHFSELESSDIYGATSSTSRSTGEQEVRFKQLRRIIFIVAVLAVIFAIYKLSSVIMSKKASKPQEITKVLPQKQPVSSLVEQAPPSRVEQSIISLNENMQTVLTKLGSDVGDIKGSMGDLQQSISALQTAIQNLSGQLQQQVTLMQEQQALLKELQPRKKPKRIVKRVVRRANYYVEAMVPGRAWLRTPSGTTLTVSVGDQIRGYEGIVDSIDPHAGEVRMSSGTVLTYRSNDR